MKIVTLLVLLLGLAPDALFQAAGVVQPRERRPAPEFSLPTVDGRTESLKAHRGKIVLVHFWATWCAPCRKEFPDLEALHQQFRDRGWVLLAVSVDRSSRETVRRFVQEMRVSFPILLDPDQQVRRAYFVRLFPTTYFIGQDGRFLGVAQGERAWGGEAMGRLLEALVGNASSELGVGSSE